MSWSSGIFSRLYGAIGWRSDYNSGTGIDPDRADSHDQDLADGINACLHKGGQNAATGDINLGSNKIINLASGTAATDAANISQIQKGAVLWGGTSGGSADAQTLTLSPAITEYTNGMRFAFVAGYTNVSTTPTLNINGIGAITVKNTDSTALISADIVTGIVHDVIYYNSNFYLQNPFSKFKMINANGYVELGNVYQTAASGTTQSDAPLLSKSINKITAADGTKGVKLPAIDSGSFVYIFNQSSSNLKVYPYLTDAINNAGPSASITMSGYTSRIFVAVDSTLWMSIG